MIATQLYKKLDEDFIKADITDDWSFMQLDNDFIAPSFKAKYMGLVLDNTQIINKVYTATFPDNEILHKLFDKNESEILLFSHHAMGYNPKSEGFPFYNISIDYLKEMKKRKISFYMLHTPLDCYGEYSTSVSLAKALGLDIVKPFCEFENINVGVICKTEIKTALDFSNHVEKIVGHEVLLRPYGKSEIEDGLVAVAAGGGSYPFVASEIAALGINLYLTGFTKPLPYFEPTMEFHRIAKDNQINVIGATHYSTEKFACMAMINYFLKLGIRSEFIDGKYYNEDF